MLPKSKNSLVVLLVMFTAMAIGTLTTIDMGDQPQAQQIDQARDALPLGRTASAIVDGHAETATGSGLSFGAIARE